VNEEAFRRIEAALEERKRQRRKASAQTEPRPVERRGPVSGRRDKDERPASVPTPVNSGVN
jgi:hypothetical protein